MSQLVSKTRALVGRVCAWSQVNLADDSQAPTAVLGAICFSASQASFLCRLSTGKGCKFLVFLGDVPLKDVEFYMEGARLERGPVVEITSSAKLSPKLLSKFLAFMAGTQNHGVTLDLQELVWLVVRLERECLLDYWLSRGLAQVMQGGRVVDFYPEKHLQGCLC